MLRITLLLCLFASLLHCTLAIKCYTCESPTGKNLPCEVNPSQTGIAPVCNACALFTITNPNIADINRMGRKCVNTENFCPELVQQYENQTSTNVQCSTCNTPDLCNSSEKLRFNVLIVCTGMFWSYLIFGQIK